MRFIVGSTSKITLHAALGTVVCALLGLSALGAGPAEAADWLAFGPITTPEEASVAVRTDTPTELNVEVGIAGMSIESRETPDGLDTYLEIPGQGHLGAVGAPAVPVVRFLVEVPHGATWQAEAWSAGAQLLTLGEDGLAARLYPNQPPHWKTQPRNQPPAFERDWAAYRASGFIPAELVSVTEAGTLRGHRLALVEVHPIAYDPVGGELLCHDQIEIQLHFSGADMAATRAARERYRSAPFDRLVAGRTANAATFLPDLKALPDLPIGLLIIAADTYATAVEPLAEWKTLKGCQATIATLSETGSSAGDIEDYIADAYNTWPIPPTWVLLVGDTNTIPYTTGSSSGTATDLYYGTITGSDYLPEVHIGRFPARSATDVSVMVEKVVDFEKLILSNGIDFLNAATFIASNDAGGMAEDTHDYVINHWFDPAGMDITRIWESQGGSTSDITQAVDNGTVIVNYSGHGATTGWGCVPFSQSNVRALSNLDMYPFVVSNACVTGQYNQTECFAETWVVEPNKGATAFWGSSANTLWDQDDILEKELWEAFWTESRYSLGAMCDDALLGVYNYYGGSGYSRYYFECYNIMGDPSMDLWATLPDDLAASHPASIFIGQSELSVSVTSDGAALDSALVCAYKADEVYATGYTNGSGQVTLTLDPAPASTGDLAITVTKHDHEPYFGSAEVTAASGPYVTLASWVINDDQAGTSNGNGDGDADSGERLEIRPQLSNEGADPAYSVVATLSASDPYVTVQDGVESFGTIPAGSALWAPDDFDVTIAGDCPDGHMIHLDVLITCDEPDSWETAIDLTVEAPELTIAYVLVDDTAGGDGNGVPDPGETCDYHLTLRNDGSEDATNVSVELTSAIGLVQVAQGTGGATLIAPGTEVELTPVFELTVSPYTPEPEIFDLDLELTADWAYAASFVEELAVGGFWDDVEAGEGGWSHTNETTDFVDQWHRSSQRNHTPDGGWSWKHGDTGSGDYANLSDGCLVSEAIPLATTTELAFWHRMDAETSGAYPDYCYDGGLVEISIDGGAWAGLTPEGGYPYLIREGGTPGPFPAETPVYSGSHDWVAALFTLEELTGESARFRFRFGSDGADTREGWFIDDVRVSGTSGGAADVSDEESRPLSLTPVLYPSRPNPSRATTTIAFDLAEPQSVRLAVFDAGGRLLRTLAAGPHGAGTHRVAWDGRNASGQPVPSGVYYCRLETGRGAFTRSLTWVR